LRHAPKLAPFVISAALAAATLSACGTGPSNGSPTATLPPLAGAERGKALFVRYCNTCHPGGMRGAGPALIGQHYTDEQLRMVVRKGKNRMPGYNAKVISDEELTDLVAHVQSLK